MAPIHHAARKGDVEELRRLLAGGYSPNAIQWMGGDFEPRRTPLHVLCRDCPKDRSGRVACFKLLRDAGANLEATDAANYTPLNFSALRADVEMVSLLIQAGVNVNAAGPGITPLYVAIECKAPHSRVIACCELLLKAGANVNLAVGGFTPLHAAARRSHVGSAVDCVDLLLKAGADRSVNVEAHGWTPLALALNRGHRRIWPLLLRAGADVPGYYSPMPNPYLLRVQSAGGFGKYAQDHLARITPTFASMLRLPAQPARRVAEFWLHAGYY